jgi:uncharacterized protein (TIGR04376 family)
MASLFDDINRFLEERLEEYLRANPHLELQALEEQLREQEEETLQLLARLQRQEKDLQSRILETAQEVQLWHGRVAKARSKGREDLAEPAAAREAALLRQGNQLWGQMMAVRQQADQSRDLFRQVQARRRDVADRAAQAKATAATTPGWSSPGPGHDPNDPLEQSFRRWELEDELSELKKKL